MEELNKKVDELVKVITTSKEYQKCLELKQKMQENKELKELINSIKILQKKYLKSNYDESIKQELEDEKNKLSNYPIYTVYNDNLEIVNNMINIINDELNNYFYQKLNNDIM